MLRSILVSATLEGLEPGARRPRPPVPVVWFDRIRRVRAGRLHALAADLAAQSTFPPIAIQPVAATATVAAGDGWRVVLCSQTPVPAPGTVA